ncbi:hypothetical protein [Austwickia chelonae]|uniref:hypothetical protein n=1 Tax=Austwickia chelonae TaxID=100225 RepID=UPI001F075134|nr:hypothetical protein [Austwickia chelonae]
MPPDCPKGNACYYQPAADGFTLNSVYYKYGVYNFTDVHGMWLVCNNQTGGAKVTLHHGYNATGKLAGELPQGACSLFEMGPINSTKLRP